MKSTTRRALIAATSAIALTFALAETSHAQSATGLGPR